MDRANFRVCMLYSSFFYLFEVGEFVGVFDSLDETVDVAQVGELRVFVFHAAGQDVGDGAFVVEFEAEFTVDSPKDGV